MTETIKTWTDFDGGDWVTVGDGELVWTEGVTLTASCSGRNKSGANATAESDFQTWAAMGVSGDISNVTIEIEWANTSWLVASSVMFDIKYQTVSGGVWADTGSPVVITEAGSGTKTFVSVPTTGDGVGIGVLCSINLGNDSNATANAVFDNAKIIVTASPPASGSLYIGANAADDVRLGSVGVDKVMMGTTEVWAAA